MEMQSKIKVTPVYVLDRAGKEILNFRIFCYGVAVLDTKKYPTELVKGL